PIVILCYDYLITLDLEVEYFWRCSSTGFGTILFYINRYLSLLGNIPIIIFFFLPEQILRLHRCHVLEIYQQFFLSLVQLVISILFILRLYAIYDKDKRILGFLCMLATGMVGNGLVGALSTLQGLLMPGVHRFNGIFPRRTPQV
ncbi:hypothetical protein BDP27DRAFT_1233747, partial [Rhodocollybia butyracea]